MNFLTPLWLAAFASVLLLLVAIFVFIFFRRRSVRSDTSKNPLDLLKQKTADFHITYSELRFGQLLGKGSQGEVFKADWR